MAFILLVTGLLAAQEPAIPPPSGDRLPLNGIAARVNRDIITWREVDERIGFAQEAEKRDKLRRAQRPKMVEDLLFLQAAREYGITVTEQEIDEQVRRDRKRFKTEKDYIEFLRDYQGVTRTQNRKLHGRDIRIRKLYYFLVRQAYINPKDRKEFIPLMVDFVTPAEVRKYYEVNREQFEAKEYVHVGRIGLQFAGDVEKARKRLIAESALRKLAEETDFIVLASRISDVHRIREDRRDFTRQLKRTDDFFSEETRKLLFETLDEKQVSGIVEDGNTLNIFLLMQRVRREQESFQAVQGRIMRLLESRNRKKNRDRLLKILIDRAFLEPSDIFTEQ